MGVNLFQYKTDYCKEFNPTWAVGLSVMDNEKKVRKNLKLPMFKQFKGIIALILNPTDGVVKQTGMHRSHYTWWRTSTFQMSNLKMLQI